jgi:hypothetical protein
MNGFGALLFTPMNFNPAGIVSAEGVIRHGA